MTDEQAKENFKYKIYSEKIDENDDESECFLYNGKYYYLSEVQEVYFVVINDIEYQIYNNIFENPYIIFNKKPLQIVCVKHDREIDEPEENINYYITATFKNEINSQEEVKQEPEKKLPFDPTVKEKGKRGRPRKNPEEEDTFLPQVPDDDDDFILPSREDGDGTLPGLDMFEEELPGLDFDANAVPGGPKAPVVEETPVVEEEQVEEVLVAEEEEPEYETLDDIPDNKEVIKMWLNEEAEHDGRSNDSKSVN